MSGKRDVDLRDAWHHKVTDVDMDFGRQEIVCLIILTCCFEKWQTSLTTADAVHWIGGCSTGTRGVSWVIN